jgi:AcrR family transcriptional regulator
VPDTIACQEPEEPALEGPRPQRLPAARRRDQLLDVALGLFGAHGYHDTSMEGIAESAGVTKPVLYQHFPSKRRLYLELLETVGSELTDAVTSSASATTPYQQVLAGFRAYFRFVARRPSAFRLLFGSGARRRDEFADAVRAVEDDLARTIAGYIDAGLDPEHRAVLGYAIVGLAEVTGRQWASQLDAAGARPAPDQPAATQAAGQGRPATQTAGRGRPATQTAGRGRPATQTAGHGLDPADGDRLAQWLADLAWAGLRSLPPAPSR